MNDVIQRKQNDFFRQLLFLAVLIFVGIVIWKQLGSLLGSFLGATTIYVVLRSPLFYLTEKKKRKWRPWIASLFLVILTILVLLIAGFIVYEIVASEIPMINTYAIMDEMNNIVNMINDKVGYALISKKLLIESRGWLANIGTTLVSGLFNTTYSVVINSLLMIVILYFMLANGRRLENNVYKYSPFKGTSMNMVRKEVKNMIFSNAVGIPVTMVAQGITALLGYWIAGVDKMLFWAFITALTGIIPLVGTGIVWLPLSIYLFFTGNIWQAIVLIIYGVVVISNADNVCRMILLKSTANVHPLIVVFGVILGIPLFGFWGIIFGPLLISGFLLLFRIYFMEYHDMET